MTTAYTSLLGLALPVTGELSGTWGDTVNTAITSLLDTAVAGTTSITVDADITLSTTTGASNEARQAIILWNPASGTVTRNITAPAQSKLYTVINASGGTQSIVIRGAGPTTGVTIAKGESAQVAWNGSDFVKVGSSGGAVTFTNLTVTGNTILGDASADTLTVNATSTFAAPVSFQGLVSLPSTGRSAAAALTATAPAFLYGVASTYTDTASSGTIAAVAPFYSIAQPTLSTSNVTTYTNAATLYIANAPAAGGSATITNPYSLYINAGTAFLNGPVILGNTLAVNGAVDFNNTTDSSSPTTGAVVVDGGVGIAKSLYVGGNIVVTKSTSGSSIQLQSIAPYAFPGDFTIQAGGQSTPALTITDNTAAQERLTILTGETVFNEAGANQDFRIESDTQPNMFFLDAGNDRIGFKTNTPVGYLTVGGAYDQFLTFVDQRTNSTGTYDSYMAWQTFGTTPLLLGLTHNDFSNTNRRFFIKFAFDNTPTYQERMGINYLETVFNESSADVDFRVESDTNTHALFVDAGNSRVGINQSTPAFNLDVGIAAINTDTTPAARIGDGSRSLYIQPSIGTSSFYGSAIGWTGYVNSATYQIVAPAGRNTFGVAVAAAEYDGSLVFYSYNAGSTAAGSVSAPNVERLRIGSGTELVINEASNDYDFRVESDTNTHALFVDAGNSKTGFNFSAPTNVLHAGVASPATLAGNSDGLVITTTSGTAYNTQLVRLGASYSYSGATGAPTVGAGMLYNYGGRFFFVGDGATASDFVFTTYGANRLQVGSDSYEAVFNQDGLDYDFRVESDTSTHALWVDASANTVQVNTSTTGFGKLNVYSDGGINQTNWGTAGNSQGNPFNCKIVRWVGSAGSSNKLVIPFLSQGSLNSTTVCRVMGHNAQFNTNSPNGFDFTFAVGHLNALYNLAVWGTGGNYSSIAINGMNVEITFTSNYGATGGEPGGLFLTLEYMSNNPSYSIQSNSIVMA